MQILVATPYRGRKPEGDRVVQGLRPRERVEDIRERQAGREGLEADRVGGWVITQDSAEGKHVPATLEHAQHADPRVVRRGADEDHPVRTESARAQLVSP